MKALTKTIPAPVISRTLLQTNLMILSCILLQSCIMTTVVQEIEDTVATQQEHYTPKTETIYEGLLTLQIQNNAENTMLQIDSLEICNTHTLISTPLQLHYGTDITITNHCSTSIFTPVIKIHGTLHSYLLNNETYPIYSGTMYYPITGSIPADTANTTPPYPTPIAISIHPNCPLYAIINGKKEKVLQPITFTATVVDWE